MIQGGDQTGALTQGVASTRLHQSLEHAPVHVLDRGGALTEILERLERAIGVAQADDAVHRVAANVLDRREAK